MKALRLALLFAAVFALSPSVFAKNFTLGVEGMTCTSCVKKITKKLKAEPGVKDVKVDLEKRTVTVATKEGAAVSKERIGELLKDSGYTVVKAGQ